MLARRDIPLRSSLYTTEKVCRRLGFAEYFWIPDNLSARRRLHGQCSLTVLQGFIGIGLACIIGMPVFEVLTAPIFQYAAPALLLLLLKLL